MEMDKTKKKESKVMKHDTKVTTMTIMVTDTTIAEALTRPLYFKLLRN